MSEIIAVVGPSGSGKSTSIRNLDPSETFIINVANKALPLKGYKKNYTPWAPGKGGNMYAGHKSENIVKVLTHIHKERPEIKQVIIDDSNYSMAFSNMEKMTEKGFEKFVVMAKEFFNILNLAANLRDDLKIFFFAHDENVGDAMNPKRKFKTVGKLLDNAITIEGLFTYVLFTHVEYDDNSGKSEYTFLTNNDGTTTAKTPMGCFEEMSIPNDLKLVIDAIDEYNEG